MTSNFARPLCVLLLLAAGVSPLAAQKWQIQYFYDEPKSQLRLNDIQFASPMRGIAVGVIQEGSRQTPTSLVTSDGGLHWQTVALKEEPLSLFFLNENMVWLVTSKGIWRSLEAGKSWTKLPRVPGPVTRCWFLDELHGFAVGVRKSAFETLDGGKTWKRFGPEAAKESSRNSAYTGISFASPKVGVITGWSIPQQRFGPTLPEWVDPEETLMWPRQPNLNLMLTTEDGGKHWNPSSSTLFGVISRLRLSDQGTGLGLIRYGPSLRFPSDVFAIQWPLGSSRSVHRDAKFSVSDIWLTPSGRAYLSGSTVRGQIRDLVPTRVQVYTSTNLKDWTSMPVDYHAEATGTVLAGFGENDLWMATDTGMILKLAR